MSNPMEAFNITLKPWTHQASQKSKQCCLQMLHKKSLIDLFKCMGNSCAYTTNDGTQMEQHLFGHDPPLEMEKLALSCAYCTTATTTPGSLVKHVREIHGQCRFQCLFCFYRAFEEGNVFYHQQFHHSTLKNVKSSIVELPSNEMSSEIDYLNGMCTELQNKHNILTCTICQTTHASISLFYEHVYEHRDSAIQCPICRTKILKPGIMDHLNHHRSNDMKCLYCNITCESKQFMLRHLSDYHLTKAMVCALKMQRIEKPYDIFVLENLGFDVPANRILLATYVTGGVLLTPKMTPPINKTVDHQSIVENGAKQMNLPKIVKVQGGIVFSEDGSILQATDAVLTKSIEPDKATNVLVAGLEKKTTLTTATQTSATISKVGTAVSGFPETCEVLTTAKNYADDVSAPVKVVAVAKQSDRAPTLDIQPPVYSSKSDDARKIISTSNVINMKDVESTKISLNRPKMVAKNLIDTLSVSKVRSLQPGPSIRATASTGNFDCAVNASAVGTDASELKHETNTASSLAKQAQTHAAGKSADGLGSKGPLPEPNRNLNPTVSRMCVKLTRLEDGSLVLKFPSTSNTTSKPHANADKHEACSVSTSNAGEPAMSHGNKEKPFAILRHVADFTKIKTSHHTVVHAKSSSLPYAEDKRKNAEESSRCKISRMQTLEINNIITKKHGTAASTVSLKKPLVLPETASQRSSQPQKKKPHDNASHLKAVETTIATEAQTVKRNGMNIDTVIKDLPTWNKYGMDLTSLELKHFLSHWPFIENRIDMYHRVLTSVVSRSKMKPVDCFVCGAKDCQDCFLSIPQLKAHMTKRHFLLKTTVIACKHCDCLLCGIDAYVTHIQMHIMCRFVCFMCFYNHFLMDKLAEHMKEVHKCKTVMLSFVHPEHVNPLKDPIILMPADLNLDTLVKYIDRTIQSSNNETLVNSNWVPEQANITVLYNCGFCKKALGNKLSLKKHLLICNKRNYDCYQCAHCEMRFQNWTEILDEICRHLYYHGENLYECSVCKYRHFLDRNVFEHVKQHSDSYSLLQLNVIRKSNQLWKCSLCFYQTKFQQGVMEHIQSAHNLPGERYMCSLCDGRMQTESQTVNHCAYQHHGKQVTMIEMYHPRINESNKTSNLPHEPRKCMVHGISYEKVNTIKAKQLVSRNAAQFVNPANNNTSEVTADCSAEHSVGVIKDKLEKTGSNEEALIPNSRKRKHECWIDDASCEIFTSDEDIAKDQENVKILGIVQENKAIDVRTSVETNLLDPQIKRQRRDPNPKVSPISSSRSSPTSQRRASRRVAAKSDAYNRWRESVNYCCQTCKQSFVSFSDFKTHGLVRNEYGNNANEVFCVSSGSQRCFWLISLARCFYCKEQNTCSTLMLHCREKHHAKSFACTDLSDSLKCGLCLYRNETGKKGQFLKHFQACHNVRKSRMDNYEYINESYFEWALSLGKNTLFDGPAQKHVLLYMCHICNEENVSEISMGMHVAKHVLKFACPQCHEEFKHLKILYYHFLAIHLKELVVSSSAVNDYEEQLLDVLMVFQNGLVVSKREAQHTSVASILGLKAGFQRYYSEQLRILESYKEALLLPILTGNEDKETTAEHTCKTFIQHQVAHPVLALKQLSTGER